MATVKEIYEKVISDIKTVGGADIKDIPLVSDLGLHVITNIVKEYVEQNNDSSTQILINKGSVLRQTNIDTHTGDIKL